MRIVLDKTPGWDLGTKYIDYATKRETTIIGYRFGFTSFQSKEEQEANPQQVTIEYVTRSFNGVQTVTNYETPASRIFRSLHAQGVK